MGELQFLNPAQSAPAMRRGWQRWRRPRVAVLGAGHGGLALAAALADNGVQVSLWNRSAAPIRAIARQGGIGLTDSSSGEGGKMVVPHLVTNQLAEALLESEVVLVALPASAHRDVAWAAAPFLRDGQVILLLPGRTGGALEFQHVLTLSGCHARVLVGEAQSFPFASRVVGPGAAVIHRAKRELPVAALPAERTPELVAAVRQLLPMVVPAQSVLHTSFENMGAVLHPGIALMNADRIAGGEDFRFYCDGVTAETAQYLKALDRERVAVAQHYGVAVRPLGRWLSDTYGAVGCCLRERIIGNTAYAGIQAPTTLEHRYLTEDVPTGLVPLAAMARVAGIGVPATEAAIAQASVILQHDYNRSGRTLERLGLADLPAQAILEVALQGGSYVA